MKEIVRRPRVRPRYAILGGKDVQNMIRKCELYSNGNLLIKAENFNLDPVDSQSLRFGTANPVFRVSENFNGKNIISFMDQHLCVHYL